LGRTKTKIFLILGLDTFSENQKWFARRAKLINRLRLKSSVSAMAVGSLSRTGSNVARAAFWCVDESFQDSLLSV
jgi:hypothetical protein